MWEARPAGAGAEQLPQGLLEAESAAIETRRPFGGSSLGRDGMAELKGRGDDDRIRVYARGWAVMCSEGRVRLRRRDQGKGRCTVHSLRAVCVRTVGFQCVCARSQLSELPILSLCIRH